MWPLPADIAQGDRLERRRTHPQGSGAPSAMLSAFIERTLSRLISGPGSISSMPACSIARPSGSGITGRRQPVRSPTYSTNWRSV